MIGKLIQGVLGLGTGKGGDNSVTSSIFSPCSLSNRGKGAWEGGMWSVLDQDPDNEVEGRSMFACTVSLASITVTDPSRCFINIS